MSRLLALDIGTKRTGVAYLDESVGVPLPLPTIAHQSEQELVDAVSALATQRGVSQWIIGLPRLPGGEEGAQAALVRKIADQLQQATGLPVTFVDERYSTPRGFSGRDPNAEAAWNILSSNPQRAKDE